MLTARREMFGFAAMIVGFIIGASSTMAEEPAPRTISVIAEGVSTTPPDFVIVKGSIPGRGDTTTAARKAFEAAKTSLEKEFPTGGELAGIKFLGERFAIAGTGMEGVVMAAPGGAMPAAEAKPGEINEKVQFRIEFGSEMERSGVAERVAAVIDRATKAGVEFAKPANIYTVAGRGSTAVTEFGIDNPEEVTIAACEAAVKQARVKAERLAVAAGGTLGGIVSVEEIGRDKDPMDAYSTILMMSMGETAPESEYSSDSNQPVEVRRQVRVVFALLDK